MQQQSLIGSRWTLCAVNDLTPVPLALRPALAAGVAATVPGCVHTDLLAAGLIRDPYLEDFELEQYWIGRTDWRYACRFDLDPTWLTQERIELACDGLDTVATVSLNGVVVGRSQNMHVAQRFDLRAAARAGENLLEIIFAAPMVYAEQQDRVYPDLPRAGGPSGKVNPHNMVRKMSCNMGWDWGPEVTTAGIWRPLRIEAWSGARIAQVRPLVVEASELRAVVRVHVDIVHGGGGALVRIDSRLLSPDGTAIAPARWEGSVLIFEIDRPQRWWPVGHGEQPLYQLRVSLLDGAGGMLHSWQRRIGLRTTALVVEPDPAAVGDPIPDRQGESMTLAVNGKAIYCKGANWIPDDCFPHRVTPQRYRQRITQARDANMNMLRIWGGGIYEDHAFYEACDELGVMVWQDFLFACACYPEEEPYRSLVEAEVRDNVARLSSHPSLVIWNGCNENIWGTYQWGPKWVAIREEGKRTWGLGYYLDLLPRVLAELDPSRPYWPASPYSGSMDRHPNLNEFGNVHIWDVWHGAGQYRNYLAYYPRMATEFGYHGPACYATIARAIPELERWWNSPLMQLHNKNGRPGQEQTNVRMADDFVPPTGNYDDWHYLAQVMQARALSMGIEWFRSLFPWNSGAMYWQLNDCYPVSSWSAIDGDGRAKPLLHASRRFFAPRLVTIKPRRVTLAEEAIGPLAVYLHNDSDQKWSGTCRVRLMSLAGEVLAEQSFPFAAAARSLVHFDLPDSLDRRPDAFLVADALPECHVDGTADSAPASSPRGFWWFASDKQLHYPPAEFSTELSRHGDALHLTIHASSLLRDLCVFPDRLDPQASVNDGVVTLLPGQRFTFVIHSTQPLTQAALAAPPVLNCVNRFGANASQGEFKQPARRAPVLG